MGRFCLCAAFLAAGMLFCGEEAEPWRDTVDGFLDAVGEGDVAGAAEYCAGDISDLTLYLEPGVRPEVTRVTVEEEGVCLEARTPGRPGMVLFVAEDEGDWVIFVEDSLEASRAAALNAAFGGE